MSEIKDRVRVELRSAGFGEGQINYVLGMREIAVVDRDANREFYDSLHQVEVEVPKGWVKEE